MDSASSRSISDEAEHGKSSSFSQKPSTTKSFSSQASQPFSHLHPPTGKDIIFYSLWADWLVLPNTVFHKIQDVWDRMHHSIFPPNLSLVKPCHHAELHRTVKMSWKAVLPQHYCSPQCPCMPVPHATTNVPPSPCCAPSQVCRALPRVSHGTQALSMCHCSSKLTAGGDASPLPAEVTFNTVIHLPRDGWLGWMI